MLKKFSIGYFIPWFLILQSRSIACMAKPSPNHAGDPALVGVGRAIRALRTQHGLSQEALAHDAGVDRSYMGGIERGEHNVTLINLLRISRSLQIRVSELLRQAGV